MQCAIPFVRTLVLLYLHCHIIIIVLSSISIVDILCTLYWKYCGRRLYFLCFCSSSTSACCCHLIKQDGELQQRDLQLYSRGRRPRTGWSWVWSLQSPDGPAECGSVCTDDTDHCCPLYGTDHVQAPQDLPHQHLGRSIGDGRCIFLLKCTIFLSCVC